MIVNIPLIIVVAVVNVDAAQRHCRTAILSRDTDWAAEATNTACVSM